MKDPAPALEPLVRQRTVLLTTYRRDGTPVGTPVHIAVDGDRAFVRTWDTAWKLMRIRRDPEVEVAPSTALGKPTGPGIRARARVLGRAESAYAGRALARKYPILHGLLVPLVHRLRGDETVHIELTPIESGVSAHPGRSEGSTAAAPLSPVSPRPGGRGQVACEPRGC
jgi:PPOX class probable F420-dependent enzyme